MTCSPTPPQPITTTLSPAATRGDVADGAEAGHRPRSRAAPPATAAGPSGIGTAPFAATTVRSAKHAVIRPCCSVVPSGRCSRDVPSISMPFEPFSPAGSHRLNRPARHASHDRHDGTKQNATWSPGTTWVTPLAHRLDDPGTFVTEHHRPAARSERAVGEVQIGVADAGRRDAHEHLVGLRRSSSTSSTDDGVRRLAQHGRPGPHQPTRQRSSASRSGSTPSPGPGRRRDRPVGRDLERRRQQPVAPLGRPRRRVERHLDVRAPSRRRARRAG